MFFIVSANCFDHSFTHKPLKLSKLNYDNLFPHQPVLKEKLMQITQNISHFGLQINKTIVCGVCVCLGGVSNRTRLLGLSASLLGLLASLLTGGTTRFPQLFPGPGK